ncbi:heavy metal translocating P-type ATPase [Syntrophomonas palmitatica]|uniref:heavy metal translocating P-type ATPase n=1 Tax=Syntrophomonas palmitatica TaxID=402877 RepID=UPI0009F81528|nr:heavy metal translocating P-type ATPase [Syntrophomonas palmitatica]
MAGLIINPEDLLKITGENEQAAAKDSEAATISVVLLQDLDCADCAAKLEKRVQAMPGVKSARINFAMGKLYLEHQVPIAEVLRVVKNMGYRGHLEGYPDLVEDNLPFWRSNNYAIAALISAVFLSLALGLDFLAAPHFYQAAAYILAIGLGAYHPARTGLSVLITARELDMNILMTLAAVGAAAIGQYQEGAVVVFLFALGNALQAYSLDRTRNSIRTLMELAPAQALIRRNGVEVLLNVEDVEIGDIMLVKPGEKISMDGQVVAGASAVNQAAITGESMPAAKQRGDQVFAGTLNQLGALEVKVTRLAKDNTVARIIHLVEEAQGQKAPSQQFIDRFAHYYTPAVILGAVLVAVLPPLVGGYSWSRWFYEALAMLLVACPCALVISTPVSIVSAIGNAARQGIMIKGGAYLEQAGDVRAIAMDKTGTLTSGQPELTDIILKGDWDEARVLGAAAAIEKRSEHPLAQAILNSAQERDILLPDLQGFASVPGKGARGIISGEECLIGSPAFLAENGISIDRAAEQINDLNAQGRTTVLLGAEGKVQALLAAADRLRENSPRAVRDLHAAGISNVIMLTGDNYAAARRTADLTGVDHFRAELMPEDKLQVIRELQEEYGAVAMVGDGVNDAPALAAASLGIAMGVAGSDAAIDTADIALMGDDLSKLAYLIALSRKTLRIIKQNIGFSLLFKGMILLLVVPGWLTLWLAVAADMGTTLLVTMNGLRLLRFRTQ